MTRVVVVLLLVALLIAYLVWRGGRQRRPTAPKARRSSLAPARPIPQHRLPPKLLDAAKRTVLVGVSGKITLPPRIELRVHPDDLAPLKEAVGWLTDDLTEALRQEAEKNGWELTSGPRVVILEDESHPVGAPRAVGRMVDRGAEPDEEPVTQPMRVADDEPRTLVSGVQLRLTPEVGDALNLLLGEDNRLVLGRSKDKADVVVDDPHASSTHCLLSVEAGKVVVEDLESTNGTRVDGQRVDRAVLSGGEQLSIGGLVWKVELDT